MNLRITRVLGAAVVCGVMASAQESRPAADIPANTHPYETPALEAIAVDAPEQAETGRIKERLAAPATYILGPGDQVTLTVADLDEFTEKSFRIDMRGDLNLPLAGRVRAAGLTLEQLESDAAVKLARFLKTPEVVASVAEFRSQPVSVLGAVGTPGIHQLEGQKRLFQVLSIAGGLRPDAGNTVKITREQRWGRIPLEGAKDDATGRFSTATVKVGTIMRATDPAENIVIRPNDVITVPKADMVYAVGSVTKPGGFALGENETISALQVISLAAGLEKTAAPAQAKILRSIAGSAQRTEIPVNVTKLMAGKAPDVPLRSDDILFIPNSAAKSAGARALEAVLQTATGVAIYGRY